MRRLAATCMLTLSVSWATGVNADGLGRGTFLVEPATRLVVKQHGRWGYIDVSGRIAVPCRFTVAEPFQGSVAAVKVGRLWGMINESGQFLVRPVFASSFEFDDGLASVVVARRGGDARVGLMDLKGCLVVPPIYARVECAGEAVRFRDDRTGGGRGCRDQGAYGYMDKAGKVVVPAQFEEAGWFREGLAPVMVRKAAGEDLESHWGYIDLRGRMVIKPQFATAQEFSEGLAAVSVEAMQVGTRAEDPGGFEEAFGDLGGGTYGYIDRGGRFVVPPRFTGAFPFDEGRARVSLAGESQDRWIDRAGSVLKGAPDDADGPMSEGLRASKRADQWGYRDEVGAWRIEPAFDRAGEFDGGMALVRSKGRLGWIGRDGKFVIEPRFGTAEPFHGGIAVVAPEAQAWEHCGGGTPDGGYWDGVRLTRVVWGVIDRQGRWVIEPCLDVGCGIAGGLTAVVFRGNPGYLDGGGNFVHVPEGFEKAMRRSSLGWVRR